MLSCFSSINVLFDQYDEGKKSKKTLIKLKQDNIELPLILISTFLCTVKLSKNDLFSNYRRKMKELSKKELWNVTPASKIEGYVMLCLRNPKINYLLNLRNREGKNETEF